MISTWHERWQQNNTAWDLQGPHPLTRELLELAATLSPNGLGVKWLIPGCGRAHDAKELLLAGVKNVTAKDLVPKAIDEARLVYGSLEGVTFESGDVTQVTKLEESTYDGIFDRAMLCALNGDLRQQYVIAMTSLLRPGGVFASIPFAQTGNPEAGPPFAISERELRDLFGRSFEVLMLEPRVSSACDQKILKEYVFIAVKRS
jgi:methyl halide transferase